MNIAAISNMAGNFEKVMEVFLKGLMGGARTLH
jgi:hypothetical protein